MASKVAHALTRSLDGLSLAEGSMLLRLRRASIALLGLVGAVGLGLVFFISQIGWPGVLSGPLPGPPSRVGRVDDAIALMHPQPAIATAKPAPAGANQGAGSATRRAAAPSHGSHLGRSKQLGGSAVVRPGRGTSQPGSSQPAPAAEPATPAPTPSATPTVASSPPQSSSEPVNTSPSSNASKAAVAKAAGDNSKSTATTTATKSTKDQGSSSGSTKSSEASSAKAKRDESTAKAKAKAPPAPAPAPTPEKSAPTSNPAAAKEAADAAKANQAAH